MKITGNAGILALFWKLGFLLRALILTSSAFSTATEPTPPDAGAELTNPFQCYGSQQCMCCHGDKTCLCKGELLNRSRGSCSTSCIGCEECLNGTESETNQCPPNAFCKNLTGSLKCSCSALNNSDCAAKNCSQVLLTEIENDEKEWKQLMNNKLLSEKQCQDTTVNTGSNTTTICYYVFDQKLKSSLDDSDDVCRYKETFQTIMVVWKKVFETFHQQQNWSSFFGIKYNKTESTYRYRVGVSNLNVTQRELLKQYSMRLQPNTSSTSSEALLHGPPPMPYNECENECGQKVQCSTSVGNSQCQFQFISEYEYEYEYDPEELFYQYCATTVIDDFTFSGTSEDIATSSETCDEGYPRASVVCKGILNNNTVTFAFDPSSLQMTNCDLDVRTTIASAFNETLPASRFSEYASYLQLLTSDADRLSEEEYTEVVDFFSNISQRVKRRSVQLNTETSFRSIATVASQLARSKRAKRATMINTSNVDTRLRRVAENLPAIALRSSLSRNRTAFRMDTYSFLLHTQILRPGPVEFSPFVRENNQSRNFSRPFRLIVPSSVVASVLNGSGTDNSNDRTAFIIYKQAAFFASKENISYVLSVDIGVDTAMDNLNEFITMQHLSVGAKYGKSSISGTTRMIRRTNMECVFWSFENETWSRKGCFLNHTADPPECLCNHLTNFALIVTSRDALANFALEIVSAVGCVLSIVCLIITGVVIIINRDLRKHRSSKILLHICCNLAISYLIFVTGVSQTDNPIGCIVVALLLHYFLLATWCWMAVYSFEMYRVLVTVFVEYQYRFVGKASAFCYFLPAVIASITAGVVFGNQGNQTNPHLLDPENDPLASSPYHADHACWLKGHALNWGFLLPVGVLLLFNFFVFCKVTHELRKQNIEVYSKSMKRTTKQSLLIATSMTFTVGIAWVFGYFLLISSSDIIFTVLSWLFAISNTFQGVIIFLLTTIRRSDMRSTWLKPIRKYFSCCGLSSNPAAQTPSNTNLSTDTTSREKKGISNEQVSWHPERNVTIGTLFD